MVWNQKIFNLKKTYKLIVKKFYESTFYHNFKEYM